MDEFLLISGKLNNRQKQNRLGKLGPDTTTLTTLVEAENVDFDNNGETTQRLGREVAFAEAGSGIHSMWVHPRDNQIGYFIEDAVLWKLEVGYSNTMVTTLNSNNPAVYECVNDEVVITNGTDIGWLNGPTFTPFSPGLNNFETPTVPGQYLAFFRGVLYVASGSILYASKPYHVEVMDERYCQFPMNGHIRMLGAVEDGIWIGTEKTIGFMPGKGVDEFEFNHVSDNACPDGCFLVTTEETDDGNQTYVTWVSKEGFCQGTDGGDYANLSGNDIALPEGTTGHLFRFFNDGIRQFIAVIHGPEYDRTYSVPDLNTNERTI